MARHKRLDLLPCQENDQTQAASGMPTFVVEETTRVESPSAVNGARAIQDASLTGNRIKAMIKDAGISGQEEFSRLVGISFRQANRIVLGKSNPSFLLACRMAAVLNRPVTEVFKVKIKFAPKS